MAEIALGTRGWLPKNRCDMTNEQLLNWCLRQTWKRLGGVGPCPWRTPKEKA